MPMHTAVLFDTVVKEWNLKAWSNHEISGIKSGKIGKKNDHTRLFNP